MSAVEGFLKVRNFNIHYTKWGDKGGRIVLLHSMGMDDHSMDLLCESLKERYQILALTNLAHGESTFPVDPVSLPEHAALMRECYRRLDFSPCVIVGHSIGGRMGMILAAEHPEEIMGLILVDIAPPDPAPRQWKQQTPEKLADRVTALAYLKERYPGFTPEYIQNRLKYGFEEQPDGSMKPKPTGNANMTDMATDLWPYVERIRVPAELILGGESHLVTPEKLDRMRRGIPELEVVTITGASHMVPQDKPREFEEAVQAFLNKIKW